LTTSATSGLPEYENASTKVWLFQLTVTGHTGLSQSRSNATPRMPLPPALFSKHATERTNERFKVSPEELTALMNDGLGKRIGASTSSNRIHRLLWSPEDNCLLVAIQEVVSGTVLTVLTLDMYKRDYADNLSENRVRHVINQMVHAGHIPAAMWQPGDNQEYVTVHAHLAGDSITVALGRWTGQVSSSDLSQLGKSLDFWTWVAQRLAQKQHAVDNLLRVEARFTGGQNWEVPYLATGES
jgi:hypothetical protein